MGCPIVLGQTIADLHRRHMNIQAASGRRLASTVVTVLASVVALTACATRDGC